MSAHENVVLVVYQYMVSEAANVTQTPVPSRRFLPPSGSSATKSTPSSSGRRNAFQFAKPSQVTSSIPTFPRASQVNVTKPRQKDEIIEDVEASEQDASASAGRINLGKQDTIEDSSQLTGDTLSLQDVSTRTARVKGIEVPYDDSDEDEFESPILKRRRIDRTPREPVKTIDISSSSEADEAGDYSDLEIPLDETRPSPSSATSKRQSAQTSTRFRSSTVPRNDNLSAPPKALFKTIAQHPRLGISQQPLPDTFSPSKKKGRVDYVPGGVADTVRNWIIQAAIDESQQQVRPEQVIQIQGAAKDSSQRFMIVTDTDNQYWVLPDQTQTLRGDSTLSKHSMGNRILIRGSATKWPLQILSEAECQLYFAADWHFTS